MHRYILLYYLNDKSATNYSIIFLENKDNNKKDMVRNHNPTEKNLSNSTKVKKDIYKYATV